MSGVTYITDTVDHPRAELGPVDGLHTLLFTESSPSLIRGRVYSNKIGDSGYVVIESADTTDGTSPTSFVLVGGGDETGTNGMLLHVGGNGVTSQSTKNPTLRVQSFGAVVIQAGMADELQNVEIGGGMKGEGFGSSARSVIRSWERHRAQGIVKTAGAGYVDYTWTYEVAFANRPVVMAMPTDPANNNDSDGRCWIRSLGTTSCIVRVVHADPANAHTFDLDLTAIQ